MLHIDIKFNRKLYIPNTTLHILMVLKPGDPRPTPSEPTPTTSTPSSTTPYAREQQIRNVPTKEPYEPSKYETEMGPWPLEPGETDEHYIQRISGTLPKDLSENKQELSNIIRSLEIQDGDQKYRYGDKVVTASELLKLLKQQMLQLKKYEQYQRELDEYYRKLRDEGFSIHRTSSGEITITAPSNFSKEEDIYYRTLYAPSGTTFKTEDGTVLTKEQALELVKKQYDIWIKGVSSKAGLWAWSSRPEVVGAQFEEWRMRAQWNMNTFLGASNEEIQTKLDAAVAAHDVGIKLKGEILYEFDQLEKKNATWNEWAAFFAPEIKDAAITIASLGASYAITRATPYLSHFAAAHGLTTIRGVKTSFIIKAIFTVSFGLPIANTVYEAATKLIEVEEELKELEKQYKQQKIDKHNYEWQKEALLKRKFQASGTLLVLGYQILKTYAAWKIGQQLALKTPKTPRVEWKGEVKGGKETLTAQKYTGRIGTKIFGRYGQKATISRYTPYTPKGTEVVPYKPPTYTTPGASTGATPLLGTRTGMSVYKPKIYVPPVTRSTIVPSSQLPKVYTSPETKWTEVYKPATAKGTPWSEVESQLTTPKEPSKPWYQEKPWYAPKETPLKPTTDLYPSYEDFGVKPQLQPVTTPKVSRSISVAYAEPKAKIISAFGTQTEVTTQPITETLTSIKTEPLMWTKVYTKPTTLTYTKTSTLPLLWTSTLTKTDTKTLTETKTKTLPLVLTQPLTKTKTQTLTQTLPQTQTLTQTLPLTLTKTQTLTLTQLKIPILKLDYKQLHKKPKREGYHTYVKEKGKYKKVTEKPLIKQQALGKGAYYADNTPVRTFYIKPAKKAATIGSEPRYMGTWMVNKPKFRKPIRKGKESKKDTRWIEKTKYNIDTPGELKGITVKGLQKLEKMRSMGWKPKTRKRKKKLYMGV